MTINIMFNVAPSNYPQVAKRNLSFPLANDQIPLHMSSDMALTTIHFANTLQ